MLKTVFLMILLFSKTAFSGIRCMIGGNSLCTIGKFFYDFFPLQIPKIEWGFLGLYFIFQLRLESNLVNY